MSKLPPAKNENGFTPRVGQLELIEWCSVNVPAKDHVTIQWPTGYGKSIGMALLWKHVRDAEVANRLMIVVGPSDIQRKQIVNDFAGDCELVGASCNGGVWCYERAATDLMASKTNKAEVFVCTVSQLHASMNGGGNTLKDLFDTGSGWFLAFDEYQHLGEDMKWGESAKMSLQYASFYSAMSATPYRRGVPTVFDFGEPDLVVRYQDASKRDEVKRIICESYGYEVTALVDGEEPKNYTTQDLLEYDKFMESTGLSAWEERQNIRFSSQYVHPLIINPVERLKDKSLNHGKRLQMLVRSMSCLHAQSVCKQIQSLLTDGMSVDWVGTGVGEGKNGRPSSENEDIIASFCPRKDEHGDRPEATLDILVQVGMAGEGFDSVNVCEIVDLFPVSKKALTGRATVDKQFYGRGARVISDAIGIVDLHVSIPTDHPLSIYATTTLDEWMDHVGNYPPEPGTPVGGDSGWLGLPELVEDRVVRLTEINRESAQYKRMVDWAGKTFADFDPSNEVCMKELDDIYLGTERRVADKESEQAMMKQIKKSLDTAIGRWAYAMLKTSSQVSMTDIGVYKKRVNQMVKQRFGPRGEMSTDKMRMVYDWIKAELDSMRLAN